MARYKITDNQSGRSLVIEGVNPPTEQDAENLFQQAGLRTGTQRLNPLLTKQPSKPLPSYQEWAMSQKSAPLSEAISTRGTLGAITGAVLSPAEQVVRSGLGATTGLLTAGKALTGDRQAEEQVLRGNIPFLSEAQERAFRSKSSLPSAVEGIRQGANVISYNTALAPTVRGRAGLGALRGASAGFGQTESGQPITQQIGQTLQGAATGAVIEGALPLAGAGIKRAGQGVTRTVARGAEALQPITQRLRESAGRLIPEESARAVELSQRYGVELPLSARRPGGTTEIAEATAVRGIFGNKLAESINNSFEAVNELQRGLRKEVAPETFETLSTGQRVQRAFRKYVSGFTKRASEKYDAIPNLENVPATATNTVEFLQNIVNSKSKAVVAPRDLSFYQEALQKFKSLESLSAEDIRETLKAVGSRIDDNADIVAKTDKASIKKLYSTLQQDLEDTLQAPQAAGEAGEVIDTKAVLNQLREADKFYKGNITKIRSQVGRNLTRLDPERVLESVVKPNNPTGVKLLKDVIGEEGMEPIRQSLFDKMVFESLDRTGEIIDPLKLKSKINKYGYSTLKELLTPQQFKNLSTILDKATELAELKQILIKSQKVAQGSQTAFIGGSITNIAGLLSILNPIFFLPYLAGQYSLAQVVGSNKTFTEVIKLAKKAIQNASTPRMPQMVTGTGRTVQRALPTFTQYLNIATQGSQGLQDSQGSQGSQGSTFRGN